MIHVCISLNAVLLCIITGTLCDYCSETARYSDAAVSPNLKTSKILRVTPAASMRECTSACCDFPDCDVAWMFQGRCYLLSCQREGECEPKTTSAVESHLAFVRRLTSLRSGVRKAFYKGWGELAGSASTGRGGNLEGLFAQDPSLDHPTVAGDDREAPVNDGSLQGPSKDREHGSQDRLAWDPKYNPDVSSVEAGGVGEDSEEVTLAGIHSGIPSDVEFPANGPEKKEWPDGIIKDASDLMAIVPLETVGQEDLRHDSNGTDGGLQEEDVFPSNSSLPKPLSGTAVSENTSFAARMPGAGVPVVIPVSENPLASQSAAAEVTTVSAFAQQPVKELVVSAGANIAVTRSKDSVELNTFVVPAAFEESPYSYQWNLVSHPVDFEGLIMEGQDSQTLKLSQLTDGLYVFRVSVSGEGAYGEATVNVTVKPALNVNQSPIAIAIPEVQEVNLPPMSAFIDGSRSTDDDRIVSFRWEEIDGPLRKQKASGNTTVLHLSNLVTGNYTFRLTVLDSDGLENSTTARVTVTTPADDPPVADAGPNQVVTLPRNNITLNGNHSRDDHVIVNYEWSLSADSKGTVAVMQGLQSPCLQLSAMQEGEYTFQLTVTDSSGQRSSAKVTVHVQPEVNSPPVAIVGPDKELISPVESTTLNGEGSTDDQGIASYHWELISGSNVKIEGKDKAVATVLGLQVGFYQLRLTVTDQQGLNSSKILAISVKEEVNGCPVANGGGNHVLSLPNNSITLDGSRSTDDQAIVSYLWTRDGQSPAAGEVMRGSDHDAMLQLANLVEGKYIFHLTVTDAKGKSDTDSILVKVRPDSRMDDLVELVLHIEVSRLTEQQKETLVRQLAVILGVQDEDIKVQKIQAHSDSSTVLTFYVQGRWPGSVRKGADVVGSLQKRLMGEKVDLLVFKALRIDTVVCSLKCSGHGHCDPFTKRCACHLFWTENPMWHYLYEGESNCEWNILYVILSVILAIVIIGGICWACNCCCKRKRTKVRKKTKYTILDDMDDDDEERMALRPKYGVKHRSTEHNSSLMVSESEFESDQNTLFSRETVEKENCKAGMNGSLKNGGPFHYHPKNR
ncbi:dyslexia-associated protein KIAA0319-like [Rhinoraja longicauda]